MAMNEPEKDPRIRSHARRSKLRAAKKSAKQGEERAREIEDPQGLIRFKTGVLPAGFASLEEKRASRWPGPVVVVIVIVAIIFIAIITWFVAHEPLPENTPQQNGSEIRR
ncbi:MAG TPA: hypothetical protein VJQ56_13145 [Blastocatellia bacterium]|nr:hypothetical protein [Blastocatellia bacterium]